MERDCGACILSSEPDSRSTLSVVLPVFNGSRYLREAIDSVLAQTYGDFELLIRDDGSKDDTLTIVHSYKDPRIRVLPSGENLGIFGNLNRLLAEARNELVKIFCQDDRMLPACLAAQHRFMITHPEVAFCRVMQCEGTAKAFREQDDGLNQLPAVIAPARSAGAFFIFGNIPGNLSNVMLRRSVWREVGMFRVDLPFAGDFEFWFRVAHHYPFGIVKERLNFVRNHSEQASVTLNRSNELAGQLDRVFSTIYQELPLQLRKSRVTRLYATLNVFVQSVHRAVLLSLRGRQNCFAALKAPSNYRYGVGCGIALYVITLNRRLGMSWLKSRMLRQWSQATGETARGKPESAVA